MNAKKTDIYLYAGAARHPGFFPHEALGTLLLMLTSHGSVVSTDQPTIVRR